MQSKVKKQEKENNSEAIESCFNKCLYFSVGRLYRLIDRLATEAFSQLEISPSHAFIIMVLNESKGHCATPSILANIMELDPSTITRLIVQLEKLKFVKRTKEGRKTNIKLQEKGIKLLPEIRACWQSLHKSYLGVLGESKSNSINKHINS